jgi:diguanylate cyclase (GGDEF)-like protein
MIEVRKAPEAKGGAVQEVESVLMAAILATCIIFGLAWNAVGSIMQVAPKSARRLAVANVLVGAGVVLWLRRDLSPGYLSYHGSDFLVLAGIAAYREGVLFMLRTEIAPLYRRMGPVALFFLVTVGLSPDPSYETIARTAFAAAAGWMAAHTFLLSYRGPDSSNFSVAHRLAISWPFFATALAMALRLVQSVYTTVTSDTMATTIVVNQQAFLWQMLIMLLVVNVSLAALASSRMIDNIRTQTDRDTLTGCLTRRALEERLQLAAGHSGTSTAPLSCLYLDIDHLKHVNTLLGFEAGDQVLKHVAGTLATCINKTNAVGRFEGQAFVVLMPDTPLKEARNAAESIRSLLAAAPMPFNGKLIELTVSLGVAVLAPTDTGITLAHRAGAALQEAKNRGRNRVEVAA